MATTWRKFALPFLVHFASESETNIRANHSRANYLAQGCRRLTSVKYLQTIHASKAEAFRINQFVASQKQKLYKQSTCAMQCVLCSRELAQSGYMCTVQYSSSGVHTEWQRSLLINLVTMLMPIAGAKLKLLICGLHANKPAGSCSKSW